MSELNEVQRYVVDGYLFFTRSDYEEALQEKKAVKYLNSQMNYANVERTYKLYNELIEKKIMNTPVGVDFLKKLREEILKAPQYNAEMLTPIPIITGSQKEKSRVEKYISTRYEAESKELNNKNTRLKKNLCTSLIFNAVLAMIVAAMFFITKNSSAPNILNYERTIQDKYSTWEQQLREKQQELNDLEWKLKEIESNDSQN